MADISGLLERWESIFEILLLPPLMPSVVHTSPTSAIYLFLSFSSCSAHAYLYFSVVPLLLLSVIYSTSTTMDTNQTKMRSDMSRTSTDVRIAPNTHCFHNMHSFYFFVCIYYILYNIYYYILLY